jgi:hypothetical protein
MKGLRLPQVLSVAVMGAAIAVAACGDDTPPAEDAQEESYFCIDDSDFIDAGPIDAGAGEPDANLCGQFVGHPDDCPEGCISVG